jgi:hypothetical protein
MGNGKTEIIKLETEKIDESIGRYFNNSLATELNKMYEIELGHRKLNRIKYEFHQVSSQRVLCRHYGCIKTICRLP